MADDDLDPEESGPNRTVLIIAGCSVIALTVALVVLRAARAAKPSSTASSAGIVEGDWKASLEHLAAAFDMRVQGIDTRLEQLAEQLVMMNASPAGAPAVPAAVSLPTEPMAPVDDELMRPPPPPQVGALEPPPPSPAAVSM